MGAELDRLALRMTPIPEGHWLLGLSGGADSVALAEMLLPGVKAGRLRLTAVHVNHGLRGAEADGDEAFVREYCEQRDIPLSIRRISLGLRQDEETARVMRYDCFRRTAEETGAMGILLAHHRDDQAETFLMRLMRGAGPEGLVCLEADSRKMGIRVLRPLLQLGRAEIREALRQDGVSWREDSSNGDDAYFRNAVRNRLLPEMERLNPGAGKHLAKAVELLSADHQALVGEADRLYGALKRGRALDAEGLKQAPEAIRRRVLRRWWQECGPERQERNLSAEQTEALEALLNRPQGKMNLPGGTHAVRGRRFLHLTGMAEEPAAEIPWIGPETRWGEMLLRETGSRGNPGDGKREQEVPPGWLAGCVIRSRRPGDRIHPFGSAGSRKLQDYLTDRGIEEPWRDQVPLVCRGNEVLLAGGVGAGCVPRWKPEEAHVRMIWQGEMPWMEGSERKNNG